MRPQAVIDPRAAIDPSAQLADDVTVGPFSVIGAEVEIGSGTVIGAHTTIDGPTRIGANNRIYGHMSFFNLKELVHPLGAVPGTLEAVAQAFLLCRLELSLQKTADRLIAPGVGWPFLSTKDNSNLARSPGRYSSRLSFALTCSSPA